MIPIENPENLYNLTTLSSPTISPDSQTLYYVKTTMNADKDCYRTRIFVLDCNTLLEKPLLDEASNQICPSIQNNQLLYLSDLSGNYQVNLYDFATGESKQLTFTDNTVTHVQWLPNSNHFLFVTKLGSDRSKLLAPFHRFSSLNYQADGTGFIDFDKNNYLCEQSVDSNTFTVISHQSTGYGLRRVAHSKTDGSMTYFERELNPSDAFNHDSGIFSYHHKSKEITHVTKEMKSGIFSEATLSPNGQYLAMIGNPLSYETSNQFDLYLYHLKQGTLINITKELDIQFADTSVSDYFQNVRQPLLQWHPDSRSFFVQSSEFGCVYLNQVSLSGQVTRLSPDFSVVKEFLVANLSGDVIAFISRPNQPLTIEKWSENCWTTLLEVDTENKTYANYQAIQYRAEDGGVIHGMMVLPPNFDSTKCYPTLLNIHGGPYMMHAYNFYYETQFMAANGYITLLINPHGSYGYGQAHTYGVYQGYGKKDYTDLMKAVDSVVQDYQFVDPNQLFVTGGSYGGFMTNWIITQTNRFKAAVSQRSISNFVSMFGTSDIGYFFYKDEMGYDPSQAVKLWEASPLAYAEKVETPLLLIHAKDDLRCPFEQAQQFYTSLLYFGKTAEMLLFPNSHHELPRTGRPSYRVERLRAMLDWFERYRIAK